MIPSSTALRSSGSDPQIHAVPLNQPVWKLASPEISSGAVLVERLRTFGGRRIDLAPNLQRLRRGCDWVLWDAAPVLSSFKTLVDTAIEMNGESIRSSGDVCIVVLFTPKPSREAGSAAAGTESLHAVDNDWNAFCHLAPIPFARWNRWYTSGIELEPSPSELCVQQGALLNVKHRSRIHYWTADRIAAKSAPDALGLLSTHDGAVGDTSIANLVLIDSKGDWITPQSTDAHHGTTLIRTQDWLAAEGVELQSQRVDFQAFEEAREVFIVGSTGIACPVSRIGQYRFRVEPYNSKSEAGWGKVINLWKHQTGVDVVSQSNNYTAL